MRSFYLFSLGNVQLRNTDISLERNEKFCYTKLTYNWTDWFILKSYHLCTCVSGLQMRRQHNMHFYIQCRVQKKWYSLCTEWVHWHYTEPIIVLRTCPLKVNSIFVLYLALFSSTSSILAFQSSRTGCRTLKALYHLLPFKMQILQGSVLQPQT